ncbi:MAG: tetratricopeptide repeat protein [Lamprocystis purpurea]|jgi:tetratricopeptide (TPR) repeat protein|uniref:tetratricopeptide repeat protein n=1 Tax=Lamprocystis purpurea TaxID=61598 RepID=UPI00037674AD|nr:tetratricopeptide repeat protein [Lamprocystis purpurea]MBV5272707.1 tetratricopeptide repeat protein [Lamprocystis purpurea]
MTLRTCLLLIAMALSGLPGAGSAIAGDPQATEADWAMVPAWCRFAMSARKTNNRVDQIPDPQVRAKIRALDNSGCNGFHHYCWALIWANRGYFTSTEDQALRRSYFDWAISDFRYIFANSEPGNTCSLFPESYTKLGEMKLLIGKPQEAETHYRAALKLKPDYAPAYAGLSDLYETQGHIDKAVAILQAGLKVKPTSSALKKKFARLQARTGGDLRESPD